ncbi:MAG: hypothetical protein ACI4N4_07495 [Candidatus Fimenecus sp.]
MITVKIKRNILPALLIVICIFLMFKMPYAVSDGIMQGLKICFYTVLPSLFPFMVLSLYIIKTDILSPLYKILSPVSRIIFRQPAQAVPVIFMSLIGGFPVGAKLTASLLSRGQITKSQAQHLNMFCLNGGPAFTITAVGVSMLSSRRAGVIIYTSLCISALLIGFLTSFLNEKTYINNDMQFRNESPLSALSASVSDGVQSMLGICAWIVIFSGIISCLKKLPINGGIILAVSALTEVTSGCSNAAGVLPIPAIAAIIGFGGFCVHCQVYQYVAASELKYRLFFAFRTLHAAIAALICHLLLTVFPVEISTIGAQSITIIPFSVSVPAFLALGIMCIIMVFDVDRKKKMW